MERREMGSNQTTSEDNKKERLDYPSEGEKREIWRVDFLQRMTQQ